jgi:hypothetical protein
VAAQQQMQMQMQQQQMHLQHWYQQQMAFQPWECHVCGNHNAPNVTECTSCGNLRPQMLSAMGPMPQMSIAMSQSMLNQQMMPMPPQIQEKSRDSSLEGRKLREVALKSRSEKAWRVLLDWALSDIWLKLITLCTVS